MTRRIAYRELTRYFLICSEVNSGHGRRPRRKPDLLIRNLAEIQLTAYFSIASS
jgi:hypothetical protein